LAAVARDRAAIESAGTQLAFVHMSPSSEADPWFDQYGLGDVTRISDPGKALYREFGLEQAGLRQLAHPRVWWPWFRTAILQGRGAGGQGDSWRQLTGVFIIHRDRIVTAIRHRNSAEQPDYIAMARDSINTMDTEDTK
jgi:hypothetical protein